jgi:hypothetical protein
MDWYTFLRLRKPSGGRAIPLSVSNVLLRTASGQRINVRGVAQMKYTIHNSTFYRPTQIVDNLKVGSIIGADTLDAEGIILDVRRRKVIMPVSSISSSNSSSSPDMMSVSTNTPCTIPANGEMLINCVIRYSHHSAAVTKGREILISQTIPQEFATALSCESALYTVADKSCLGLVTSNHIDKEIFLPAGTILAAAEPANTASRHTIPLEIASFENSSPLTRKAITIHDVCLDAIPANWRPKYLNLLTKYSDIFSSSPTDLGKCSAVRQNIQLKDETVIAARPPFRIPPHLDHVAKSHIQDMLAAHVIRPSTSPFSAPLLIVAKPAAATRPQDPSSWRTCLDYRALNANTVRDSYPLFNISTLLNRVSTAKIWSVVNCKQGFTHQLLTPASCKFTSFSAPGIGHFEFTRSVLGLKNTPA